MKACAGSGLRWIIESTVVGFRFEVSRVFSFLALVRLHVLPTLTLVVFSRAWNQLNFFSLAWHRPHVFLRLAPVACFPRLGTGCVFPRLAPVVSSCA